MTLLRLLAVYAFAASLACLAGCGPSSSDAGTQGRTPSDAFREMQGHVRRGEWEALYECHHPKVQGLLDIRAHMWASMKALHEGKDDRATFTDGLEPRTRYARSFSDPTIVAFAEEQFAGAVVDESIKGDTATVFVNQYGETLEFGFTNDYGQWKYSDGANPDLDRGKTRAFVAQNLRSLLNVLRGQISAFKKKNGYAPDVATEHWKAFYDDARPMTNPLSPDSVATTILVISKTGDTGLDVDPKTAGWVWNVTDRELYAAGLDDSQQPTAQTILRPSERKALGLRQLHAARGALRQFKLDQASSPVAPDLGRNQWSTLVAAGCLRSPLTNPHSPAAVATRIVELTEPGAKGLAVDPTSAGWVWNSADGAIYLAGFDDEQALR